LLNKPSVGNPGLAIKKGETGYADWIIVSIHAIREYFDQPYRQSIDILYEMPQVTQLFGLRPTTYSDFSKVCGRKQELKIEIWRVFRGLKSWVSEFDSVFDIFGGGFEEDFWN
jgi:hypothetical protein